MFATALMGDFKVIKFLDKEQIKKLVYLSERQKGILLQAPDQLGEMTEEMKIKWQQDIRLSSGMEIKVDAIEQERRNMRQRFNDMRSHFEQHMHAQEGDLEKAFSFDEKFLGDLRASMVGLEQSKQLGKFKQLERIIVSLHELEKIDCTEFIEKGEKINELAATILRSISSLFKTFYNADEEHMNNLQAKMDLENLRRHMLGNGETVSTTSLSAYDSSDPVHLILAGDQPKNSGSCQKYDGTPSYVIGLLGYLVNSGTKIIRVENQDKLVVGRSMLKTIVADGQPALFLERPYYLDSKSDPNIDKIITELAKKKAETMGLELFTTWAAGNNPKQVHIARSRGLAPYEYSDGLRGIVEDIDTVATAYQL
ncbi:MAG: hypothetical protein PHS02_02565 [Candidatus ainarchaeum sp.]|nr:hypothetical protein [Candidatus ainarchaeum sp.]